MRAGLLFLNMFIFHEDVRAVKLRKIGYLSGCPILTR
jgi:hypothetical protein